MFDYIKRLRSIALAEAASLSRFQSLPLTITKVVTPFLSLDKHSLRLKNITNWPHSKMEKAKITFGRQSGGLSLASNHCHTYCRKKRAWGFFFPWNRCGSCGRRSRTEGILSHGQEDQRRGPGYYSNESLYRAGVCPPRAKERHHLGGTQQETLKSHGRLKKIMLNFCWPPRSPTAVYDGKPRDK